MNIPDILAAFQNAVATGQIDGAQLAELGDLVELLNVASLPLSNGIATSTEDEAKLVGTTNWPPLSASTDRSEQDLASTIWTITIIGTENRLAMTLRIPGGAPIELGDVFTDMPESMVPDPQSPGGLVNGASVLNNIAIRALRISGEVLEGSNPIDPAVLAGWALLTDGPLAAYRTFLGANELWVAGPLTFVGAGVLPQVPDRPIVELMGDASDADINFPKTTIGRTGLRLFSHAPNYLSVSKIPPPSSIVELIFGLELETGQSLVLPISTPLLRDNDVWTFDGTFDPPVTLENGFAGLRSIFPGLPINEFELPTGLAPFNAFGIQRLQLGLRQPDGFQLPETLYTIGTIVSTTPWNLPIPFISLNDVGVSWLVQWGGDGPSVSGNIFGSMLFGTDRGVFTSLRDGMDSNGMWPPILDENGDPFGIAVQVGLPSLAVTAATTGAITVPLSSAISAYFPGVPDGLPSGIDFTVEKIRFNASVLEKTYGATLDLAFGDSWSLDVNRVEFLLKNMFFQVDVDQGDVSGSLNGTVLVWVKEQEEATALLGAGAYLTGDGSWNFYAGLDQGEIDLGKFAYAFLGVEPPIFVADPNTAALALTGLLAEFSTADGYPFSVSARLDSRWSPKISGVDLALTAEAQISRYQIESPSDLVEFTTQQHLQPDGASSVLTRHRDERGRLLLPVQATVPVYSGYVAGGFQLNGLSILAKMSFATEDQAPTFLFDLVLDTFALQARTDWILDRDGNKRQVLAARLSGATLGELVQSFAKLANPNQNYRLEPPWTFLNKINLGTFNLILDPKEQAASLHVETQINLGFVKLDSVGIRYERTRGKPQVMIELGGSFLGKKYDPLAGDPLSWDALNEQPPAVPGKGDQLLDVQYLGLGQRVQLSGLEDPHSVSDIIAAMQADLRPIEDPFANPLERPGGSLLKFNDASQWLIGLDITVMKTVSVKLVMNDPVLYGVLISLSGPVAAGLSGFSFELLYKKVSNDVGLFHARLQVPDLFRQLDFGVIQLSLGIISADIYTDGDFLIDLGFPHQRDFSLSFGVAYGVFIGRGGLYFGILKGATSTRVPQITNGTFDPVLELGIGLAIGVGRIFNKGPLRAELIVQVELVFEGSLAWFKADNAGKSREMYYWARGTAAITGRLIGRVSLKIISVSVDVFAGVSATLTLEAYRSTLIELQVKVRVSGKVKIGWVKIGYSFDTQLQAAFVVGSDQRSPWIVGQPQKSDAIDLCQPADRPVLRRRRPQDLRRLLSRPSTSSNVSEAGILDGWNPSIPLFPNEEKRFNPIKLQPGFSAKDVAIGGTGDEITPQVVFLLFADAASPPGADSIKTSQIQTVAHNAQAKQVQDVAFNIIIEAMLRWSISSLWPGKGLEFVTLEQLSSLVDKLEKPETFDAGFSYNKLVNLFQDNVQFQVSALPVASGPMASGVSFPMLPPLSWKLSGDVANGVKVRNFTNHQMVDNIYATEVSAYFAKLNPGNTFQSVPDDDVTAGTLESMATYVFRTYMALVAQLSVQAATELLEAYPYFLKDADSLESIAAALNETETTISYVKQAGDTLSQVAAEFGITLGELLYLNPELHSSFPDAWPRTKFEIRIGVTPQSIVADNPRWPVAAENTISVPGLTYQIQTGDTLSAIAAKFSCDAASWVKSKHVLTTSAILRNDAQMAVNGMTYENPTDLSLTEVAALFFVRLELGFEFRPVDWYAQAIAELNSDDIGPNGALPETLRVPSQYNSLSDPITWTTLPGDTLERVARTVAIAQNVVAETPFADYLDAVIDLNPDPGTDPILLPDGSVYIDPDETLSDLASRLLMVSDQNGDYSPSADFDARILEADILQPLAPLLVTGAELTTQQGQTIADLAEAYGLSVLEIGLLAYKVEGFLSTENGRDLVIRSIPAMDINRLVARLVTSQAAASIAGQVTRFMLHGQRIPTPRQTGKGVQVGGPLAGLYDLIGQQFAGPPPTSTQDFKATFKSQGVDWIELQNSAAVQPGDTLQSLSIETPEFTALNPAAQLDGRLQPRQCILTGATKEIVFEFSPEELEALYPSQGFDPDIVGGLTQVLDFRDIPNCYDLSHDIIWQTATPPRIDAFSATSLNGNGMPMIWPFPSDLLDKTKTIEPSNWTLKSNNPALGPDASAEELANYVWATTLDIKIQNIPGQPSAYKIKGANVADIQRIRELRNYLTAHQSETARIELLCQLSVSAGLPDALTSIGINRNETVVIKTNLSKRTSGPPRDPSLNDPIDPQISNEIYFAPLINARGTLKLLWEASLVGGSGFLLDIAGREGNGLPSGIFSDDGEGQITLLVTLNGQTAQNPSRQLESFNNCAIVPSPIEAELNSLTVSADDGADSTRQAILPPGEVGFQTTLTRPVDDEEEETHANLNELYSLTAFQLIQNANFEGSTHSMATGAQVPEEAQSEQVDETLRTYRTVIPIVRYARGNRLPQIYGLPSPGSDPYRGVHLDPVTQSASTANINVWFQDMFGNKTANNISPRDVE